MIPKILHFIWVGNEFKRPNNCIETWIQQNPDYQVKIWGNATLAEHEWLNARHMDEMCDQELNGVADMMRWEILYKEGGIVIDADSICVRPLEDWMLDCEAFACWESEIARPGLIAAGYFGCCSDNAFVHQIMIDIYNEPTVINDSAWKTVGPQRLTDSYRKYRYFPLRILPSHYFIPEHFSGLIYKGPGPVYAHQMWGSTVQSYDYLHLQDFDRNGEMSKGNVIDASKFSISGTNLNLNHPAYDSVTTPKHSLLESQHDPYFVQKVKVSSELMHSNRIEVFKELCSGKRVLHVGCADWPITNPATSLHLAIESSCARLDGFDVHEEALAGLAPFTRGRLFSRFEELKSEYDLILVPEVMEHVPNVETFLAQLNTLNSPSFLITVPDAYQCQTRHFEYLQYSQSFIEVVHQDHNCWYTPYTFTNVINKYTPWSIDGLWFFNSISLLMLATKPQLVTQEH